MYFNKPSPADQLLCDRTKKQEGYNESEFNQYRIGVLNGY